MTDRPWWYWLVHLLGHTVAGTIGFLIFAMPSVAISLLVQIIETWHLPHFTMAVLEFVEQSVLVMDAGLFLVYLVWTVYRTVKEMAR